MILYLFRALAISFFSILLFFTSAASAQRVGLVTAITGEAWAEAKEQRRPLALKSEIFSEDTLITSPQAKIQLLFEDDSILALGPSTTLRIADFKFDGTKKPGMAVHLLQGIIRMVSGKVVEQNPEGFKISSPLAVIGIRGTITLHDVQPLAEHHFVEYLGPGHTVWIQGPDGKVLLIEKSRFGGDFTPGQPTPSEPRPMTPEEMNRGMMETSPNSGIPAASGGILQPAGVLQSEGNANIDGSPSFDQGLRSVQEQGLSRQAEEAINNNNMNNRLQQ